MKALYFRLLYQNVDQGIIHTVSISNTESGEVWNGCYLCTGEHADTSMKIDERFTTCSKKVDLMVIERSREKDVATALELLAKNRIEKVVLPAGSEEACRKLREAGAGEVLCLKDGESYQTGGAGWGCTMTAYGEGEEASVIMYHNAQNILTEKQDAVLVIKPFSTQLPCQTCISGDDHRCAMQCTLYNDLDLCKGHNDRSQGMYVSASLLLGNLDVKKYEERLKEQFGEKKNIRFCGFLGKGGKPQWLELSRDRINQYYVLPKDGGKESEETMLEILRGSIRHRLAVTGERNGLCATGFFTKNP